MKLVAAQAGVSTATVSMSLANHPRISHDTRLKVQAIAQSLGYQPNPYVAALMRTRRQGKPTNDHPILAIVCAYPSSDAWKNSPSTTFRQIYKGVVERAAARGYQCQDFWLHQDSMSSGRFSEVLRARGIQGALLGPLPEETHLPRLTWDYFSAVRIGLPIPELPIPSACSDNYLSSMMIVQECYRLGYRRPGLILKNGHIVRLQRRWDSGFFAAILEQPDMTSAQPLFLHEGATQTVLKEWLGREKPDGIITPAHETIQELLTGLKLRVPQDMGLASFFCPEPGHAVSGIFQDGWLIGANAVDLLISLIERHEKGLSEQAMALMIEGRWNPGRTLRHQMIRQLQSA